MPNVSKETASETIALEGLEVQREHLEGGYSVALSHTQRMPTWRTSSVGCRTTAASSPAGAT
jgi:hypothetical protein